MYSHFFLGQGTQFSQIHLYILYIFMIFSCLVGDISIFHHEFPGFFVPSPAASPGGPGREHGERRALPGLRVPVGAVGPELCAGEPWRFWKTWRIWGGKLGGFKANHGDFWADLRLDKSKRFCKGTGGDWVLKNVDLSKDCNFIWNRQPICLRRESYSFGQYAHD